MISTNILNKHEVNNRLYEYKKKLLTIVIEELKILREKFSLLLPGDNSDGDEYWYIILSKIEDYLSFNYEENNFTFNQLEGILKYIEWFNSIWPPCKNKKGNYKLPKKCQPPEILL